ncbi:hypothetical protein GCM10009624_35620 [Gordonia sinesedis]
MSPPDDPSYPPAGRARPPYPEPPYSPELLADLHAGILPDDVAAHITARLPDDPAARQVLAALDRTRADLRGAPLDIGGVPTSVDARTRDTLAAIRRDVQASRHRPDAPSGTAHAPATRPASTAPPPTAPQPTAPQPTAPPPTAPPPTAPPPTAPPPTAPQPTAPQSPGPPPLAPPPTPSGVLALDQARARRRSRNQRAAAGFAVAAVVVAIVALTVTVVLNRSSGDGPSRAQPTSTASTGVAGAPGGDASDVAMLAVLGKTDGAPFGSPEALRRCTAANDIPATTPVVGSGEVTLDGTRRIVILLGTGVAGRFTALVVDRGCDTGNPAFVSRTTIGG